MRPRERNYEEEHVTSVSTVREKEAHLQERLVTNFVLYALIKTNGAHLINFLCVCVFFYSSKFYLVKSSKRMKEDGISNGMKNLNLGLYC